MDPETTEEWQYFRWLNDQHDEYVKRHVEQFTRFHDAITVAITKKIDELETSE